MIFMISTGISKKPQILSLSRAHKQVLAQDTGSSSALETLSYLTRVDLANLP